jgi:UDP-N-acetylglucosamine:LPS N-acetylglucosamine transferase
MTGRAVILSGSTGQGHASVAEACADALASSGCQVTTVDCMELLGGLGHRMGEAVFRRMLAIPPLYDAFHFSQLRAGTRLVDRMTTSATKRIVPALREVLPAVDELLLMSVFATGSAAAASLQAGHPGWRSVAFCTDATAHRIWVQDGINRYLVSSPAEAGTVRQFDPGAEVRELPPPVRPAFFDAPDRIRARDRLGLGPVAGRPCVLLMAGGWGLGPIDRTADALARAGIDVLAVAGRNAAMRRRLDVVAAEAQSGRVRAYGFTPEVPLLMAASDVVVTSAGQTSHEARVIGRPQVLLDVVPGHGRENLLLELARGGAMASRPEPHAVVAAVSAALDGAVDSPRPWPVTSAEDWRKRFHEALDGLWSQETPTPGDRPASTRGGERSTHAPVGEDSS